jgi:hypothetical protein
MDWGKQRKAVVNSTKGIGREHPVSRRVNNLDRPQNQKGLTDQYRQGLLIEDLFELARES